ncbi:TlpA disulfide reductase family protein [Thiobacter aerophilum]|uniref:TlpA disulfide reductase family protein n=1 Tax=Thiobacter aerophilum TaxID=3121275 RepID=A0ABV0EGX0_9BURK
MMPRLVSAFALFLLTSFSAACAQELKPYAGSATPPLRLKDLAGKVHDLTDYRGEVVMVQFWATYCAPCVKEMPSMQRLAAKLAGKPFRILAVNMGESEAEVRAFLTKVNVDFTVLMDEEGQAIAAWKVFAVPSTFIVDRAGRIRHTLQGGTEWDAPQYVETLTALIGAQP